MHWSESRVSTPTVSINDSKTHALLSSGLVSIQINANSAFLAIYILVMEKATSNYNFTVQVVANEFLYSLSFACIPFNDLHFLEAKGEVNWATHDSNIEKHHQAEAM